MTTPEEHDKLIECMQKFADKEAEPQVGIFWYDALNDELFGVSKIDVSNAKANKSGLKTVDLLHKTFWRKNQYRDQSKGKDSIYVGDYTQIPRGRVFYNENNNLFEVMVGSWIEKYPGAKEEIIYDFDLPKDKTNFIIDRHWELGHGWSEEFV